MAEGLVVPGMLAGQGLTAAPPAPPGLACICALATVSRWWIGVRIKSFLTTDLAPFHLVMKNGYFREEGLDVKPVNADSSDLSNQKLLAGEVDIAYASYPPFFTARGIRAHVEPLAEWLRGDRPTALYPMLAVQPHRLGEAIAVGIVDLRPHWRIAEVIRRRLGRCRHLWLLRCARSCQKGASG